MLRLSRLLALIAALALPATAQMTQTLPSGFLNTDGNGATSFPQNTTNDHKWQWHYDSAEFSSTSPITISEIWVRASSPGSTVQAFDFPSFTVTLATATTDYTVSGHDPVFANNLSSDATVVRSGPWTGGPVAASGGSTATWIPLGLTTAFVYDPTQGDDFIVQIEKCGTNSTWGTTMDGSAGGSGTNGGNRYGDTSNCAGTSHSFNNNEFVPIVKIDYTQGGLVAQFTANPTSGNAPLTVQFTDTSFTDDPAGVQTWAWDLDGDGNTDSTAQNPSFTYTPGLYSVSLTVTDLLNGTASRTSTDLIDVGPYQLSVQTSGGGVGDLLITSPPPPPGLIEGYTLASLMTALPAGQGPVFGLHFDPLIISILQLPAAPGNFLHFTPSPGLFPAVPFSAGPGFLSGFAGQSIDVVLVFVTATEISATNVVRITP